MDEESKLSKHYHESTTSHAHYASSSRNSLMRSASTKCSATKSPLLPSFSHKNSNFSRSCSTKCTSSTSKSSSLERSSSQKCSNFTRKCGSMAKEQKAKFYIVKRCITMLVFWHKHKHVDS